MAILGQAKEVGDTTGDGVGGEGEGFYTKQKIASFGKQHQKDSTKDPLCVKLLLN